MWKYVMMIVAGVATSGYMFTFFFKFWPVLNTKNILAIIGGLVIIYQIFTRRIHSIDKNFVQLLLFSITLSIIALFSAIYNNTNDFSYVSYPRTFLIWLIAGYAVCALIFYIHKKITLSILGNYMVSVCIAQSLFALLIAYIPAFKNFINTFIEQDQEFLEGVDRMYGIGASVDVAGTRFAAVLIVLSILIVQSIKKYNFKLLRLYLISFVVISLVGNMIARTTTIGLILGLINILFSLRKYFMNVIGINKILIQFAVVLFPMLFFIIVSFFAFPEFETHVRFALEGFFNLVNKGEFTTASSDRLFSVMYVFPETLKTWVIGDGYFSNPRYDPYYVGELTGGYYMGTDAGYLRFIFYFGLIGLLTFAVYFIKAAHVCSNFFNENKNLFIMLLALNFIIWFKVSTDIFLIFALFGVAGALNEHSCSQK